MSWLSKIERKWRHLIDDLGFFGTLLDFSFNSWYSISKWLREYETYYKVSSTPLIDDWNVSNLLNGAVLAHQLEPRIPLEEHLKDASLNSMYSRFNHIAKKVCTKDKYKDVLGKPVCTEFNTKISLKSLSNATGLEVIDYDYCPFNSLLHSYNYLVDTYEFTVDFKDLYLKVNGEIRQYSSIGTIKYNNKEYYLVNLYTAGSLGDSRGICIDIIRMKSREEITIDNPVEYEELVLELPIQTEEGNFYYIHYMEDTIIRITPIAEGTNVALDKIFIDREDYQYPTFTLKACGVYTKEDRFREDLDVYGLSKKLLQRSSLDWEDIYDQITCNETEDKNDNDKSYRQDLNDVTNILITLACDITANSPVVNEYLFKLFKQYYLEHHSINSSDGELFYKHGLYEHKVRWDNMTYTKKQGHVCHWKQYATETKDVTTHHTETRTIYGTTGPTTQLVSYSETHKVLYIYYQVSRDEYYEITVTGLIHITNAFGKEIKTDLPTFSNMKPRTRKEVQEIVESRKSLDEDGDTDSSEFLIPLYPAIVRQLGVFKASSLISISLRVVWQAKKRIKKKWYATTGFAVVRIIAAIVVIICTWGGATPFVIAANAAINAIVNILIQMLISLAIKLAVKYICKIFHIEGKALIVANVISTVLQTAVNQGLGADLSGGAMFSVGMGQGLADMVLNKQISLEGFANLLSTAAFNSIAAGSSDPLSVVDVNPAIAVTYKLLQDPSFYDALQNKDWSSIFIKAASTISEAVVINISSKIDTSDNTLDYEKIKYGIKETTKVENSVAQSALQNAALGLTDTSTISSLIMDDYAVKLQKFNVELAQLQQNYVEREKAYKQLLQRNNYLTNIILKFS